MILSTEMLVAARQSQFKALYWRRVAIIAILSVLSSAMVVPYAIALLKGSEIAGILSPTALGTIQFLQGVVGGIILGGIGLALAPRLSFEMPYFDALHLGESRQAPPVRMLLWPALLGLIAGLIVLGISRLLAPLQIVHPLSVPAAWKGLLGSVAAGVSEEIMIRLGLMTFFTWLVRVAIFRTSTVPPPLAYWVGNIGSTLLFGAAHLPTAAMMGPLTPAVVLRVLMLNGGVGLLCGVFYQRRGLEWAMVFHASVDVILHFLAAM